MYPTCKTNDRVGRPLGVFIINSVKQTQFVLRTGFHTYVWPRWILAYLLSLGWIWAYFPHGCNARESVDGIDPAHLLLGEWGVRRGRHSKVVDLMRSSCAPWVDQPALLELPPKRHLPVGRPSLGRNLARPAGRSELGELHSFQQGRGSARAPRGIPSSALRPP
jgi:hypothetical protein